MKWEGGPPRGVALRRNSPGGRGGGGGGTFAGAGIRMDSAPKRAGWALRDTLGTSVLHEDGGHPVAGRLAGTLALQKRGVGP